MGDVPEKAHFAGTPEKAVVTPRGSIHPDGEVLPLDYLIRQLLDRGQRALVCLQGPVGSGKSTALAHLAAVLSDRRLSLFGRGLAAIDDLPSDGIAVTTGEFGYPNAIAIVMAAWDSDEWIEYLLARHRTACKSVMTRLAALADPFDGLPALWVPVLERMAADESIRDAATALRQHLRATAGDAAMYDAAASTCLRELTAGHLTVRVNAPSHPIWNLLRCRGPAMMLAGEKLAQAINEGTFRQTTCGLRRELISEAGRHLTTRGIDFLAAHVSKESSEQPIGVSLLLKADPKWRPRSPLVDLRGAFLASAQWAGVQLPECAIAGADFSRANLAGASLYKARGIAVNLSGAILRDADLDKFWGDEGVMKGADFSNIKGFRASFARANMDGASFEKAVLLNASFIQTSLKGANFTAAYLREATFRYALVDEANFYVADLANSEWRNVDLRGAELRGAVFNGASLTRCNLEGMDLTDVEFSQASLDYSYLTGTRMRGGSLRNASLRNSGIAEIDWEGVDLRNVDFTHASFHLGSSRSGLVHSTIASEEEQAPLPPKGLMGKARRLAHNMALMVLQILDIPFGWMQELDKNAIGVAAFMLLLGGVVLFIAARLTGH